MKILIRKDIRQEDGSWDSYWEEIANESFIRIIEDHCIEIGHDDEYTGGFTITPKDTEKALSEVRKVGEV